MFPTLRLWVSSYFGFLFCSKTCEASLVKTVNTTGRSCVTPLIPTSSHLRLILPNIHPLFKCWIKHCEYLLLVASPQGFEPWTLSLTARCSTTELRRLVSGWPDSNQRPHGPKPCILTGLYYIPKLQIFFENIIKELFFFLC